MAKEENMDTYENFLKGLTIPFSVIVTMLINKNFYDMNLLLSLIVIGVIVVVSYKGIERIAFAKKELSKKNRYILLMLAMISIVSSFYLFDL